MLQNTMPKMIWSGLVFLFLSTAQSNEVAWVNLSLSPSRLLKGVGELNSELPLRQNWSLGAITAYGRAPDTWNIDLGIQGRYYGLGSAQSGGFIASEIRYANIIYRNEQDNFDAFFIKPALFLGGKYQFDIGLTMDAGFGMGYSQTIVSELNQRGAIHMGSWERLFRLNIGWMLKRSER